MKFGVVIAARTGSQRLPGKVLMPLLGMEVVRLVIKRLQGSKLCHHFVLATTQLQVDDRLVTIAQEEGISVYRGDEENVLNRFVRAADDTFPEGVDYIVRITADCPLVGGDTLDVVLQRCLDFGKFDLVTTKPAFHHGLDYEVYNRHLLKNIDSKPDLLDEEKEHILNYVYNREQSYHVEHILPPEYLTQHGRSFLLDNQDDYEFFQELLSDCSDFAIPAKKLLQKPTN